MKLLNKIKEAIEWEHLEPSTAKEIIASLDSDIEDLKKQQEEEEAQKQRDKDREWAEKVIEAQGRHSEKTRLSYLTG